MLLQQLQSDDIMFVYEGVSALRNMLSVANENSLHRFSLDPFCLRLIEVSKQPAVMDISNEIKCKPLAPASRTTQTRSPSSPCAENSFVAN